MVAAQQSAAYDRRIFINRDGKKEAEKDQILFVACHSHRPPNLRYEPLLGNRRAKVRVSPPNRVIVCLENQPTDPAAAGRKACYFGDRTLVSC